MVANVGLMEAIPVLWDFYPYSSSGLPKLLANSAKEEAVRLFLMPRWTGAVKSSEEYDILWNHETDSVIMKQNVKSQNF